MTHDFLTRLDASFRDRELIQHLVDALQALALLTQRLHVTAKQQEADARHALDVIERAVAMLEQRKPRVQS